MVLPTLGQNLCQNGSFETYTVCPDDENQLNRANHWFNANYGSSDLMATCAAQSIVAIPKNFAGIQSPYSGSNYAHFLVTNFISNGTFYHEYVANELAIVLEAHKKYEVVYQINLADYSNYGMDRIGVLISDLKPNYTTLERISEVPQLESKKGLVLADTTNWVEIRDTFTARGGERYLTIGQFYPNDSLTFEYLPNPRFTRASYYIDGVEVHEIKEPINPSPPEPILPNVFSPNQDGVNDIYNIKNLPENSTLEVFNRWGNLVFTQQPYQNNWPGNGLGGRPLATGVYFAILTYRDEEGELIQVKQTVHILR